MKLSISKGVLLLFATTLFFACTEDDEQGVGTSIEDIESLTERVRILQAKVDSAEAENDQLLANTALTTGFYQEFFGDKNISSIHNYIGDTYIQHNPGLADGKQALIDAAAIGFNGAPQTTIDIQRTIAQGDLVFVHVRAKDGQESVMDVFRIENDLLVEHWDVIQALPAESANDHPLF